jgi:hypothetical protein
LPGVSLLMARRIVFDRIAHGPFVTRDGLRRVSGAGQVFLSKIDSLITFSGTVRMPSAADTALPPSRKNRRRSQDGRSQDDRSQVSARSATYYPETYYPA